MMSSSLWLRRAAAPRRIARTYLRQAHVGSNPIRPVLASGALRYRTPLPSPTTHIAFFSQEQTELEGGGGHVDHLAKDTDTFLNQLASPQPEERASIEAHAVDKLMNDWVERAAKSGNLAAAQRCHDLLTALEKNRDNEPSSILAPDTARYNFVLQAYAACRAGREAAQAATNLLHHMIDRCRRESSSSPAPTTKTFNVVLNAWAKIRSSGAGEEAEIIYGEMEKWLTECRNLSLPEATPNGRTLCAVMDAWTQSGHSDTFERVMAILEVAIERQKKLVLEGNPAALPVTKPDSVMFSTAINALAKSNRRSYTIEKAEQLIKRMEELNESEALGPRDETDEDDSGLAPNTRVFSQIIDAWANFEADDKSGMGAERAHACLDEMTRRYSDGEDVKPNTVAFTSCIKSWAKSNREGSTEKGQALYDQMVALYRETGDDDIKPNAWAGNALISLWASRRGNNSVERAKQALDEMQEFCQPDLYSYNSVLHAHARSRNGHDALDLLNEMKENGLVEPDVVSYNTTLDAIAKVRGHRGGALAAQHLFDEMKANGEKGGVAPNRISYSCVINAWANSRDSRKAQQAMQMLDSMLEAYRGGNNDLKPDVIAFTSTLNALASQMKDDYERKRTLKYALDTFEMMKKSPDFDSPNGLAYTAMFKAGAELTSNPRERQGLMEGIFQRCCADGYVSRTILEMFKRRISHASRKKYSLLDENPVVPQAWCANVRQSQRPNVREEAYSN